MSLPGDPVPVWSVAFHPDDPSHRLRRRGRGQALRVRGRRSELGASAHQCHLSVGHHHSRDASEAGYRHLGGPQLAEGDVRRRRGGRAAEERRRGRNVGERQRGALSERRPGGHAQRVGEQPPSATSVHHLAHRPFPQRRRGRPLVSGSDSDVEPAGHLLPRNTGRPAGTPTRSTWARGRSSGAIPARSFAAATGATAGIR